MDQQLRKKWFGSAPTECTLCSKPLAQHFVDGATNLGMWMKMCVECHSRVGVGFGVGRGQLYELRKGSWVKIQG